MPEELMSLYQCEALMVAIEQIAADHEGEIPEEMLADLIRAQTTSIVKLEKLCGYIRHLEHYIAAGQSEIDRISKLVTRAKNRLVSVKNYMTPYVDEQRKRLGRPMDVGTFRLSTRHSKAVVLTDEKFTDLYPGECDRKTVVTPNKTRIKEYIEKHGNHPGAELEERVSIQIK